MKLSVIIASYNNKELLIQAVESCLSQKFNDTYEIIIGDDGSTDGSLAITKEYAEKYPNNIKYFVMERREEEKILPMVRVSNLKTKGLKLATGEYIMILDGDDLLTDEYKWTRQIEFLEKNKEYIGCYTDFKNCFENGDEEYITFNYSYIKSYLLYSRIYIHISSFIFRREVLDDLDSLPYGFVDDCNIFLLVLKRGKVYHLPGITFGYRQREKSIIHQSDKVQVHILELGTVEYIKKISKLYFFSALSRYYPAIMEVYTKRNLLSEKKFQPWIDIADIGNKSYIRKIKKYDNANFLEKLSVWIFLLESRLCYVLFGSLRNIIQIFNKKSIIKFEMIKKKHD